MNDPFLREDVAGSAAVDPGLEDADVGQVAVFLGVVQAIAHHKGVGDGEAGVVDLHRLHPAVRLVQQGAQADGGGVAVLQDLQQIAQGVAAVQDVLHHDDVAVRDVLRQVLGDLHLAAGLGALAIGGDGHKVQRAG